MDDTILVFGFGSLINARSRARTLGDGPAWPVRVRGLRRAWCAPGARIRHTALGVRWEAEASCNGVLSPLPRHRIEALDAREAQYTRVSLSPEGVTPLGDAPPDAPIVTYLPRAPRLPEPQHPIIRSYVDVTLSGCLDYGEAFAEEMITTTDGWDTHLEDERHAPRYPLHEAHAPREALDALLERLLKLV